MSFETGKFMNKRLKGKSISMYIGDQAESLSYSDTETSSYSILVGIVADCLPAGWTGVLGGESPGAGYHPDRSGQRSGDSGGRRPWRRESRRRQWFGS